LEGGGGRKLEKERDFLEGGTHLVNSTWVTYNVKSKKELYSGRLKGVMETAKKKEEKRGRPDVMKRITSYEVLKSMRGPIERVTYF